MILRTANLAHVVVELADRTQQSGLVAGGGCVPFGIDASRRAGLFE